MLSKYERLQHALLVLRGQIHEASEVLTALYRTVVSSRIDLLVMEQKFTHAFEDAGPVVLIRSQQDQVTREWIGFF
jgi:hypothetical protein